MNVVKKALVTVLVSVFSTAAVIAECGIQTRQTDLSDSRCITGLPNYWKKTCSNFDEYCGGSALNQLRGCKSDGTVSGTCTYKYYSVIGCNTLVDTVTVNRNFTHVIATCCINGVEKP